MSSASDVVDVRRRIALAMLPSRHIPRDLGDVTLEPHQQNAAQRLCILIARHGGALLADVVGSGKTYTALAVARTAVSPVVVIPAALRDTWTQAMSRAGVRCELVSVESLSRDSTHTPLAPDLVIVDESHHFRNSATRRYGRMAALCASANVLLLSATPVQNRSADLASQLALFLGARAHTMSDTELASYVVRRGRSRAMLELPTVDGPHWIDISVSDDWLDELLGLPQVVGPIDGGDGGALLAYVLVRRWASSRAALLGTLRRRLAAALALESALSAGRRPTRRELSAWSVEDDAMQLAFPELVTVVSSAAPDASSCAALLVAVREHRDALSELMARIRRARDPDIDRAAALARIMDAHPGEIIIAFSEHAETVAALARHLVPLGGVVCLTSQGARTASGRLTRDEVLRQLEPGGRLARATERVRLVISTDVLSEGVNLQRASVVVHVDLPWNPARLEQRVGRIRRFGAIRDHVTVYALSPPADSERLLDVEQRLRRKLDVAARAIGVSGRILPPPWGCVPEQTHVDQGDAELESDVVEMLRAWAANGEVASNGAHAPTPRYAAVSVDTGERPSFLALVRSSNQVLLVTEVGGSITSEVRHIRRAIALASSNDPAHEIESERVDEACAAIARWSDARVAARSIDSSAPRQPSISASNAARRGALARLARIGASLPRQARASAAPALERARSAVARPLSIGAEQVLATIVDAPLDDRAWLQAIDGFAQAHLPRDPQRQTRAPASAPPFALLALLLFVPRRP